jgi:hypothetical protein
VTTRATCSLHSIMTKGSSHLRTTCGTRTESWHSIRSHRIRPRHPRTTTDADLRPAQRSPPDPRPTPHNMKHNDNAPTNFAPTLHTRLQVKKAPHVQVSRPKLQLSLANSSRRSRTSVPIACIARIALSAGAPMLSPRGALPAPHAQAARMCSRRAAPRRGPRSAAH